MENYPIINKRMMMQNAETKAVWKAAKKYYARRKRHGQPLKGALLKVVQTPSADNKVLDMTGSLKSESKMITQTATNAVTETKLTNAVKSAGIHGMSGNGFPVYQKLEAFAKSASSSADSVLLVNAVECDPGLIHDEWLVKAHFEEIERGIDIISQAFHISRSILVTKAVKRMKSTTSESEHHLEICHIPARYPAGEEHFLIQAVLGISLPKSELPVNHGILVMNVQTVWQIVRILNGTFDGGHYITVADIKKGIAKPAYVNESTSVSELLQTAFGARDNREYKCYAGGGIMTSHEVTDAEICTDKISFAAYLPSAFEAQLSNRNKCKGCGACSRKCPAGIDVRKIVSLKEQDPNADISMYHPEACLHCGSCTWYCHGNKTPEKYMNS